MNKPIQRRPSKRSIEAMKEDLLYDLLRVRRAIEEICAGPELNSEIGQSLKEAIVNIETFAAISLQIMSETNQSKLREAMRLVEIRHLMKQPVLGGLQVHNAAQPHSQEK